jgi:hypothetical protein
MIAVSAGSIPVAKQHVSSANNKILDLIPSIISCT